MTIRPTQSSDIAELQAVLDATELFPSEMLPDMIDAEDGVWLTCLQDSAIGFCFAQPEAMTDGTWNMRAIAVAPDAQGHGHGTALVAEIENVLRKQGGRVIIVDTSGTDDFAPTRSFYAKAGYAEAARLPDFWAPGDDKVTFWKALS